MRGGRGMRVARTACAAAAGALVLAACTGSLLQTKRSRPVAYQLAVRGGARGPAVAADVKVLTPLVHAGLDSDRIAAAYPDRRLDYFAGARWSAPLDETLGELAVEEFRARSGLRNAVPDGSALQPRYWLEIEVVSFEARYGRDGGPPTVDAHFVARVGDSTGRRTLARIDARAEQSADANRMGAIVAAFEAAADRALGQIVSGTDRALAARAGR